MSDAPTASDSTVTVVGIDEAHLLSNCPFCGYALTGLPMEHVCPECGQGFRRQWRVFGGVENRRRWKNWSRLTVGLCSVPVILLLFNSPSPSSLLITAVIAACTAVCVIGLLWSRLGGGCFIAVESQGIAVGKLRRRLLARHAWQDVGTIKVGDEAIGVDSTILVRGFPVWGLGYAEANACARTIDKSKMQFALVKPRAAHSSSGPS